VKATRLVALFCTKSPLGRKLWNTGFVLLVLLTLAILLARTGADPDLWGHLRFGLDTLQAQRVIRVDPYSYVTGGQEWINHEWLAEVSFALAWQAGGAPALILLKTAIGLIIFGLVYRHLHLLGVRPLRGAILLLVFSLGLLPFMQHVRPQMFTYLFFTLILDILYWSEASDYRWLWGAPPVMLVWANMHGGVLAGLGVLGIWTVCQLETHWRARRQIIPPIVVAVIAVNVNPYGAGLMAFLLHTATVARPEIQDWQPIRLASAEGIVYALLLVISLASIFFSRRMRRPALLLVYSALAVLPWLAIRHLPLFSIAGLILAGEHIGDAWDRIAPQTKGANAIPPWAASLPWIGSLALLLLASALKIQSIGIDQNEVPFGAVALLKESGVSGDLATEFDWGEYVIWQLGPQVQVSIDGRRETVYRDDVYRQSVNFMLGTGRWDELLSQDRTDMALVMKGHPDDNLLRLDPDWMLIFDDPQSAIFVRKNSALAEPLMRAAAGFSPPDPDLYFR